MSKIVFQPIFFKMAHKDISQCRFVKSGFISKLVIKSEASNSQTSLVNEKESFIVYSLFLSGLSNWSQNLASLLVGNPIADKFGRNDQPSSSALWILASPYRTSGLEPDGYMEISS